MKFLFPLLLAFTLSAPSGSTADGKTVSYKSGDETVQGILYTPTAKAGPYPALIVIHEWWGLNANGGA